MGIMDSLSGAAMEATIRKVAPELLPMIQQIRDAQVTVANSTAANETNTANIAARLEAIDAYLETFGQVLATIATRQTESETAARAFRVKLLELLATTNGVHFALQQGDSQHAQHGQPEPVANG